jgi:hypothetical protein
MKRPIAETYQYMRRKLEFHRPYSLRKQACLQYLKWGVTTYREDRDKFVDLIKKWRKEDKKIGAHRTLLERKARKLFQQVRRDKSKDKMSEGGLKSARQSVRNKTGLHSPEFAERRRELGRQNVKRWKENGPQHAHHWIVHPPEGEPFKIYNLSAFCREHGLNQSHMCRTALDPKRRKHHKGWRAEKYNPIWKNL